MKLILCHICGEEKEQKRFRIVPYFRKYKKRNVVWCERCQKMYMEMKKEKERVLELEKQEKEESHFIVSFD